MTIAHYFGETHFCLFWESLLCLSTSVQSCFFACFCFHFLSFQMFCFRYVFLSPLSKTRSLLLFVPLHLHPWGHFCYYILFFMFVPFYSSPLQRKPWFLSGKGALSPGVPRQSGSLLRYWRGSAKGFTVPEGGLRHVWLCLHPYLELDCLQTWRNKLHKQIKRPGAEYREQSGMVVKINFLSLILVAGGVGYSTFFKCLNLWFFSCTE
jgi:hypothetical protein